ncbi:kinase-like protein [Hypoxylon sp. FL1857]|nr:kinase-like protein [Hypoxylon sp. FL1857]
MALNVDGPSHGNIESQDATLESEKQAQLLADDDADCLLRDSATTSTTTIAIPLPDDPAHGLQWISNGNPFSPRPKWTIGPTIDSIILTLKAFIDQSGQYSVRQLWDGAYNRVYSVAYEDKRYVMRVSLPVCPRLKTESEVATLEWICKNTRLPVPNVICYDSSRNSPVGFEWILMGRIDGVPLSQCWQAVTRDAKERIVKQIVEYAAAAFKRQFEGVVREGDRSTDADADQDTVDKGKKPREPTMLWHDAISLDNILVDENGVLCGVIDWACVSCLPLYEACQFPAFLQQARDRPVEPLTPHRVTQKQPDSKDISGFERDSRQHELTLLRKLFMDEMMDRCPEWVHIFNGRKDLRDYEAAVQNCDNEFAYEVVESWVDAVENGGIHGKVPWRLHERLM